MRLTRPFFTLAAVISSIVAAGCGGGGSDAPPVGPPASVSAVSGSSATITAGATSPLALTAKVLDAGGHAVAGATVTWGTGSGSISPATAATDGSGQTTAQWVPGKTAGAQTATASVTGAGTATFTATVTPGPLAKIKLTPDTTKLGAAGTTAQLSAAGLDAFDNAISGFTPTYTIDDPTIATVSGTGLLTSVKTGTTTVHATSGSVSASAIVVVNTVAPDPCAGVTMTLGVGQSQTLTGAAAGQFCVTGATGAEFVAIPFFGTGNGGSGSGQSSFVAAPTLNVAFNPLTNVAAPGPPTPSVAGALRARAIVQGGDATALHRDYAWESKFRQRFNRQFSPLIRGARLRRAQAGGAGARTSLGFAATVVGDKMSFNVNVAGSCTGTTPIIHQATVKAVSTHAIVVADDSLPANGFLDSDYASIANAFDSQVWLTDTDNFGVPYAFQSTSRDPNGHIILFFTGAVNKLTPKGSNSFVGGFFFGRDLFKKTDTCGSPTSFVTGSNEAEMFYLLAPDPNGDLSTAHSVLFVRSITIGTVAHEFQHLINAAYRLYVPGINFSTFEETFLDEGLAHSAEELNFYTATGKLPRANIDATGISGDATAYSSFAQQNAARFREYLKNPEKYPPYSVLADTSLAVRGGIWSFLRYATDRRAGGGILERNIWNQLVNPTKDVAGLNNLKEVYGSDILTQMRDWSVANYLDDAIAATTPVVFQHPSWNTRSVETFVNGPNSNTPGTTFPLKTFSLTNSQVAIGLADGGAAYLRFGVNAGSVGGGTLNVSSALPSSFSITVIRTK